MGCAASSPNVKAQPATPSQTIKAKTLSPEEQRRQDEMENKLLIKEQQTQLQKSSRPVLDHRLSTDDLGPLIASALSSTTGSVVDAEEGKRKNAALLIQRQARRRQAKVEAMKQQRWIIFSNLDTCDEADVLHVALFMNHALNKIPTLHALEEVKVEDGNEAALFSSKECTDDENGGEEFKLRRIRTQSRQWLELEIPADLDKSTEETEEESSKSIIQLTSRKSSSDILKVNRTNSMDSNTSASSPITTSRENSVSSIIKLKNITFANEMEAHDGDDYNNDEAVSSPVPVFGVSIKKKRTSLSQQQKANEHVRNARKMKLSHEELMNYSLPSGFITPSVAAKVIEVYRRGGRLSEEGVHKILRLGYRSLKSLPNTTRVIVGPSDRLTVVGDIHGQLFDLLHILDESGFPSVSNKYVFNGDFVDRGPYGLEVMCILLALHSAFPTSVHLNRGNHEDFAICCAYGFQEECIHKYNEQCFGMFVEIFTHVPLFSIVNDTVLILHGGLFHSQDITIADFNGQSVFYYRFLSFHIMNSNI